MKNQLELIKKQGEAELLGVETEGALEEFRVKYLGKKGELTSILKQMGGLSAEERPVIGQLANEVRVFLENTIESKGVKLKQAAVEKKLLNEAIDVTVPGQKAYVGHKHPLSIVLDEVKAIFIGMGFEIAKGPEVELDYYNFEALNIPKNHPARDTQDTFYINENILLRTQTSPVQIRVMEQKTAHSNFGARQSFQK